MNKVQNVTLMEMPIHLNDQGYLAAFDAAQDFQIDIQRLFVVSSHLDAKRGKHAHKDLTQILVCVSGACKVLVDDGYEKQEFLLDRPNLALKIPPHIWAEQYSKSDNTVLVVACDLPFDENDYIRDYDNFLKFRSVENCF